MTYGMVPMNLKGKIRNHPLENLVGDTYFHSCSIINNNGKSYTLHRSLNLSFKHGIFLQRIDIFSNYHASWLTRWQARGSQRTSLNFYLQSPSTLRSLSLLLFFYFLDHNFFKKYVHTLIVSLSFFKGNWKLFKKGPNERLRYSIFYFHILDCANKKYIVIYFLY